MNQRSEDISDRIESAQAKESEAEKLKEEYQQKLSDAKQEAREIIEESRRRGKKKKEEIVSQAEEEANRKIAKAEEEINIAKLGARKELKDEVADIATQMSKKALSNYIAEQELQEETINQFIEQLDQEKLGEVT